MKQIFSLKFSFVVLALICMSACLSTKRSTAYLQTETRERTYIDVNRRDSRLMKRSAYWHQATPGGIWIDTNLLYDQSEVSNFEWRGYMIWNKQIFGDSSKEYKATEIALQRDWEYIEVNIDSCSVVDFPDSYFTHPAYNDYPLMLVSQKQAEDFAKWRSDRVFERILVLSDKMNYDTAQNQETYFTIEKYYTGKYQNIKPDTNFRYYPDFRLPNADEWKRALYYEDSIEKRFGRNCTVDTIIPKIHCRNYWLWGDVTTKPVDKSDQSKWYLRQYPNCRKCVADKHYPIYYLRGNVSEWTSEKGIAAGGGWAHTANAIMTQDTFHVDSTNAWTGFRNVCEWKEWKMK